MLRDLINDRTNLRIAVIGLGYVGLPLAVEFTEQDVRVIGVDISPRLIDHLYEGESPVEGLQGSRIKQAIQNGRLELALANEGPGENTKESLQKLIGVNVFIVCVPTPLKSGKGWAPDLGYIRRAEQLIRRVSEIEQDGNQSVEERLIILESTSYPGTTREIFYPLISDFSDDLHHWYLAYSPERTNPGPNAYDKTSPIVPGKERGAFQITRIVGGMDAPSGEHASALYKIIYEDVRTVATLATAEMVKLVENTFRFVAIGFSNEMSRIAKSFGLNVWEIIDAVKSKDFGLDLCYPGLIGGHCLPIDPHYLGWWLRNRRHIAKYIDAAEEAHQDMRQDALDLIQRLLNRNGRGFAGSSILFFGISYKKNVGDIRESAALDLLKRLHASNARVAFWDPVLSKNDLKTKPRIVFSEDDCRGLSEHALSTMPRDSKGNAYFDPEELRGGWGELRKDIIGERFNCLVLVNDHEEFKECYRELLVADNCPPIADLANCIPTWLNKAAVSEEIDSLRKRIDQLGSYMLLGVH